MLVGLFCVLVGLFCVLVAGILQTALIARVRVSPNNKEKVEHVQLL